MESFNIIIIIISISLIIIGCLVLLLCLNAKKHLNAIMKESNDDKLLVGDIIAYSPKFENPFKDNTWEYELVTEVKMNENGETYYKSSKCNIIGVISKKANDWEQNTDGAKYTPLLYKIVNHIILE